MTYDEAMGGHEVTYAEMVHEMRRHSMSMTRASLTSSASTANRNLPVGRDPRLAGLLTHRNNLEIELCF